VGIRVKPEELTGLSEKIRALLGDESYGRRIREIREKYIANFGRSGEVGGKYIIDEVKKQVQTRKQK
jgi:YidC/Oxa1 family membrane protein insertase